MKTIRLGSSNLQVPQIAIGCWRIHLAGRHDAELYIRTAIEEGAVFFDNADIYGNGKCEEILADSVQMSSSIRDKIIVQTKCGIRKGYYDFSKKHILDSVDGSLRRLKTDYIDILLLHRPDALIEPEEVAGAFDLLKKSGKVRNFGVSNHNPAQIKLLQKYIKQPLLANQLQFGIAHASMLSTGLNVNMMSDFANDRDGGVLDFCRLNDITIQAWSPFQYGFAEGVFLDNENFAPLNKKINELAEKYSVKNTTIALAWILRHPAKIQPIIGTMKIDRLRDCIKALDICLTREEWYGIYLAAGNKLP
ncbi:MAG: aldo/keto reductase [Eubacteriales bacterium]|nr:aldo/keto reductase [Eubacteriales bacterium]MDD4422174.1 aldo/keto reductase [Eubacteriales bacterium]